MKRNNNNPNGQNVIFLLCATKPEWGPLKNWGPWKQILKSPASYHLEIEGKSLTLIQLGLGPKKAEESLKTALDHFPRPDRILHFGVSGSLVPEHKIGDVFWISNIITSDSDPHKEGHVRAIQILSQADAIRLFTSPTVLYTPSEKKAAADQFGAHLVDMESFPCAKICAEKQIPYFAVRSIFDTVDMDLSILNKVDSIKADGNLSLSGLAEGFVKKPKLLFQLPHIKSASDKAIKACCHAVEEFIKTS